MARDRQRAKQRKARRAAQNPGPAPTEPHRTDVPGELEHASGDADEFDAALVAGAGGEPVDADAADDDVSVRAAFEHDEEAGGQQDDDAGEVYDDEIAGLDEDAERDEWLQGTDEELDEPDPELEEAAVAAAPARARRAAEPATTRPGAPTRSGPGRLISFLQASWAELQRVQWPDRRQVFQATAVVLGFVVVAGLYLGLADRVAQEVVDLII